MRRFLAHAAAIAAKDLRLEARSRERVASTATFAVLVAVVFSFAIDPAVRARSLAGAMIWVTVLFAGTLGVARSFELEREEEALTGLLLAPVHPAAVFLGKWAANLLILLAVEAVIFPVFALFFGLPAPRSPGALAAVVGLASMGFMALGTLFSAIAAHTRLRGTTLPILLVPLLLPVVIFASSATQRLLAGRPASEVDGALRMLGAFGLIYLALCAIVFGSVMEE